MMKSLLTYLFSIFLILPLLGQAQEYTTTNSKAEKAYEGALLAYDQRNLNLSLNFLGEAANRDPNFIEVYLLRFEIYTELRQIAEAEQALEDAIRINPDFFSNAWFFLAAVEMNQGKYDEAETHFERFLTYPNPNPDMKDKALSELENCAFAKKAIKNPVDFEPLNLGPAINSAAPEYYPAVSADNQMFIFTRLDNDPDAFRGKNENFYASRNFDGSWLPATPVRDVNTVFNEGAPTLSADGRTMVFTACELLDDYGEGRKGFGSCDLFIAQKTADRWGQAVNVGESVNSAAWETQPSLSADGNTLYFVRGRPTKEGVKNQDIYFTERRGGISWSAPRPVSEKINTPGKEESVMIHPDGQTLYFSSDGHVGMGGLDLYMSQKDSLGRWQTPTNLGYPINTYKDENSLLVSADGVVAFFASNREGGYGDLDLYSFNLYEDIRPTAVTYAKGKVSDFDSGEPVEAALRLYDINSQQIAGIMNSDQVTGDFLIALPAGKTYALSVSSEGYLFHSETFELKTNASNEPYALDVWLKKVKEGSGIVLKNLFFDLDKAVLKEQSSPELKELGAFLKDNPDLYIELSGHTDNQGTAEYNKALSERRAEAVKKYLITVEKIEPRRISTLGAGTNSPIASNDTEEGRAQNRRTEFKIVASN